MDYEFYYNLSTAYFISDSDKMFMDGNLYMLDHPTKTSGREILVSLEDLIKVYGPYMTVERCADTLRIVMKGVCCELKIGQATLITNGVAKPLGAPVTEEDAIVYLPVGGLLSAGFGKAVLNTLDTTKITARQWSVPNFIVAVCEPYEYKRKPGTTVVEQMARDKYDWNLEQVSAMNRMLNGRENGVIGRAFWFEPAKKIQTYSAYIPFKYDQEKPSKMIVALHGAMVGEEFLYVFSRNQVQFWSEKYNYIFCCPNACTKGSGYGTLIDANVTAEDPVTGDIDNPYSLEPEDIKRRQLGELSVMATIEQMCSLYNIDRKHIFLQGNSMGGRGTFHLASKYPDVFRAISPSGASLITTPEVIGYYKHLKQVPIRMVAGTEDMLFERAKDTYLYLKNNGYNVEFEAIGGGVHFDAWTYVIEDTFKFYERNS